MQQTAWSGSIRYLTPSWVRHSLGSLLDIHMWCMMIHLLYQIPWLLNSCFNSWNRMILRFHQGSTSWIRSRIKIGVDSFDLAQTRASLGRLASLLQVRGFTKITKRCCFEAELRPYLRLCVVLKLSYSPHLVRVLLWKSSLTSSSLALRHGPHRRWSSVLRRRCDLVGPHSCNKPCFTSQR